MNKTIDADFTLDTLLAVLQKDVELAEGYQRAADWAEALGVSINRIRVLIREGLAQGIVKKQWTIRETIDGRQGRSPVYKFILTENTGG